MEENLLLFLYWLWKTITNGLTEKDELHPDTFLGACQFHSGSICCGYFITAGTSTSTGQIWTSFKITSKLPELDDRLVMVVFASSSSCSGLWFFLPAWYQNKFLYFWRHVIPSGCYFTIYSSIWGQTNPIRLVYHLACCCLPHFKWTTVKANFLCSINNIKHRSVKLSLLMFCKLESKQFGYDYFWVCVLKLIRLWLLSHNITIAPLYAECCDLLDLKPQNDDHGGLEDVIKLEV